MDELHGKVALITGGSGGFGRAIGAAFAERGASVALADLPSRAAAVEDVLHSLRDRTRACGVQIDVRDVATIRTAIEDTVAALGSVDIVVCNAGLNVRKSAFEVTESDWDAVVDVNLRGVFFSAQAAATQMVRQGGGGKVISIASIMGLVGSPFGSGVAYCASKAGVVNMTRALAIEWAEHHINVNAVAPTYVLTPLTQEMFADSARLEGVLERTPMGKLATPEAIADAVVFLASPQADMITGVTLPVDCGWTAW